RLSSSSIEAPIRLPMMPPIAAPATPAATRSPVPPPICEPIRPPASAPTSVPVFSFGPVPETGSPAQAAKPAPSRQTAIILVADIKLPPIRRTILARHGGRGVPREFDWGETLSQFSAGRQYELSPQAANGRRSQCQLAAIK